MKPNKLSPSLLFDSICKQGEALYFRNALQKSKGIMGDIIIGVTDPSNRKEDTLRIPKNCVICVNEQTTLEAVRSNHDIRLYIRKGYIEPLSQEMYEAEVEENPIIESRARKELDRMISPDQERSADQDTADQRQREAPSYIRPAVAQIFSKAQIGDEDEEILIDDLKSLGKLTQVEISHVQGNLHTIDEKYLALRKVVLGL